MDSVKLKGIEEWPAPTFLKQVRGFLGFANFYRKFIPGYSTIAQLLHDLTKKTSNWEWKTSHERAFLEIKRLFSKEPILQMPDPTKKFMLATNASLWATRAVLMQEDINGEWHPCSFSSQSFSPTKRNYKIYN